mmetsp:Transcript_95858/g.228332  ORF Transcript_95858/g.228332 Transcript_95858/m.228332 type:complete len:272 (+) Transcript_95858:1158-1973(+)
MPKLQPEAVNHQHLPGAVRQQGDVHIQRPRKANDAQIHRPGLRIVGALDADLLSGGGHRVGALSSDLRVDAVTRIGGIWVTEQILRVHRDALLVGLPLIFLNWPNRYDVLLVLVLAGEAQVEVPLGPVCAGGAHLFSLEGHLKAAFALLALPATACFSFLGCRWSAFEGPRVHGHALALVVRRPHVHQDLPSAVHDLPHAHAGPDLDAGEGWLHVGPPEVLGQLPGLRGDRHHVGEGVLMRQAIDALPEVPGVGQEPREAPGQSAHAFLGL